ncbi:glycosyltransferase family 10 [Paracoccaceae bacterium]|nr:glycosyltransferase family 10 [Paracoccaceae bacterium]
MQSIYFYDESHNLGTIEEVNNSYHTPNQLVSNDPFKEIRVECLNYDINFDFLASNTIKAGDIIIVSNLIPFRRKAWLTKSIKIKNKLLGQKSGFINLRKLIKQHKKATFLPYLWEAHVTEPMNWDPEEHSKFNHLLVWDRLLVKENPHKYKLLNLQSGPLGAGIIKQTRSQKVFSERSKFLSTIINAKGDYSSNSGYKLRLEIADWYGCNAPDRFDLYGGGWPNFLKINSKNKTIPSNIIEHIQTVYKGTVKEKSIVIGDSKFYLCIENSIDRQGYVTEKLFDALLHKAIPVYLGDQKISEFIPKSAYIDLRQFEGDIFRLHRYLLGISQDEWEKKVEIGQKFLQGQIGDVERFLPKGIAKQLNDIQIAINKK